MGSEATAAAEKQAAIRRDPMAMLPFCGYNMGDYWKHWLGFENRVAHLPKIFRVNWFRKDSEGKFIWPGFSENMRVLKWIVDRVRGQGEGVTSPFGHMPRYQDINWQGLNFDKTTYDTLMEIDGDAASAEVEDQKELFDRFADSHFPMELEEERQKQIGRLESLSSVWRLPD